MKKHILKSKTNKPIFDKTKELTGIYYYMGYMIFIEGERIRVCNTSFTTGNFGDSNIESVLSRATDLIDKKIIDDEKAKKNYKENLLKKIEKALF